MFALSIALGCAETTTQRETLLQKNWGRSFQAAKYNQILHPEAEKNLDPVVGLDGEAAEENLEQYRNDFKKKSSKEVYQINLGSVGGAGGK
jgi:hypothetical protein